MLANTFVDSDLYRTLPVGIMSFAGQYSTDWGLIGAGMVIATVPTILIYFLLSDQVGAEQSEDRTIFKTLSYSTMQEIKKL